jgi:thymidylate kinase
VKRRLGGVEAERRAITEPRVLAGFLDDHLDYCVLHGWTTRGRSPSPPSDLDIAITSNDLEKLERTLANTPSVRVTQLLQHEATCYYFVLAMRQAGTLSFSAVDVAVDYRLDGRIYFTASDLLRHRRKDDGAWVAAPEVEFAYLLVKKVSKGTLPEHQRARVHSLYEALGEEARGIVHRLFGGRYGDHVADCLARSDWGALEAQLTHLKRALRVALLKRDPFNAIRYWGSELCRRWRRWRQPTGVCVAVLGPDGAGKSTLIAHLAKHLGEAAFRRVSVYHLRAHPGERRASPGSVTDPHRKVPHPPWLSVLKVAYYAVLYLIGYVFIVRPRLVRSTLVLFDRYYDDLLVDPRRYRYGASMRVARSARRLAPRPDLYFVLDVPEAQLVARKQEVSGEEVRRQREAYRRLAADLPNAVLLDGSLPPGEVAQRASDVLVDFLHERYVHRRHHGVGGDHAESTLQWLTSILCASPDDAHFGFRREAHNALAPRWSSVKEFGRLSLGDGRGYLIPLEAGGVGLRALDLYNAQSLKASFAKALFATGLRFGMGRRLMSTVHLIARRGSASPQGAHGLILEYLTNVLQREDLSFGISVGTPGPHRKPVLLVLGGDGHPLAYVKVGSGRVSNALVQREAETLHFLAAHPCHSFSAPAVLHSGWWNGHYLVIQSTPHGERKATVGDRRIRYLDIPKELAALDTRWMPLAESELWEDMRLRIHEVPNTYYRDTLERGVRKAEDRLKAERLPFHFSHGDFVPWNTRYDGEKIFVFDWEYSREAGLPAEDVFHFHFQEMRCLARRDIEYIYEAFLKDRALRARVDAHIAGLGLVGIPVEFLFFLYRLDQLATEAADAQAGVPLVREFALFGKFLDAV